MAAGKLLQAAGLLSSCLAVAGAPVWLVAALTILISAGGVEKDVAFEAADDGINDRVDTAYRTKYRRYVATYVPPMLSPDARATTLKLVPR